MDYTTTSMAYILMNPNAGWIAPRGIVQYLTPGAADGGNDVAGIYTLDSDSAVSAAKPAPGTPSEGFSGVTGFTLEHWFGFRPVD